MHWFRKLRNSCPKGSLCHLAVTPHAGEKQVCCSSFVLVVHSLAVILTTVLTLVEPVWEAVPGIKQGRPFFFAVSLQTLADCAGIVGQLAPDTTLEGD